MMVLAAVARWHSMGNGLEGGGLGDHRRSRWIQLVVVLNGGGCVYVVCQISDGGLTCQESFG